MGQRRVDLRRRLEAVAFRQAGYFTAAEALTAGYTYQAQKYHVDTGNWVRIDRGIFRLPHWPPSAGDEYVRWCLWAEERGVVSHDTALRVHDLADIDPALMHLTLPVGARAEDPFVAVHHADLTADDIEDRGGWRVTTPMRTLLDVAQNSMSQDELDKAVATAIERGLITRRRLLIRTAGLSDRQALRLERALSRAGGAA